jgi:hypothetical protein
MSDYDDDFMADDEDYDLEYSEDSNSGKQSFQRVSRQPTHFFTAVRGVTKICRLSWLTNSALVYEPKCGMRGGSC